MTLYQWLSLGGIGTIVGLIIEFLIRRPLTKRMEKAEKEQALQKKRTEASMLGIQALLRDRLLQAYRHYIAQGYASYKDRTNVETMYTQYEALGPNSVMDDLHEQFSRLPEQPVGGGNGQ